MTTPLRTIGLLAGLAVLTIGLAGCREDALDRPLHYTPGVYKGQVDEAIDKTEVKKLHDRAKLQK